MAYDIMHPHKNGNLAAALAAAEAGCRVFACNHKDKTPLSRWKEKSHLGSSGNQGHVETGP